MPDDPRHGEAGILAFFLARLHADLAAGVVAPLADYQKAYPGFEALIADEYRALLGEMPSSDPGSSGAPTRRFGPYRLLRSLGRGGQGEVYLAEDERLGRRVALKLLHPWITPGLGGLERFRREATIASRLDHPGLCPVYEAGVEGEQPFIAMRYVEGESLEKRLSAKKGRVREGATTKGSHASPPSSRGELEAIARLFENAARAAHAAHEAGVVHRDLKPGNILIATGEQPVLLDFGLARDERAEALTKTGEIFGTPEYMAPEQLTGDPRGIDARADVYSLGATLYECLTLKRPFAASTREALYRAVLEQRPPDPRKWNASLPRDLVVILETALEKDRERRYATALDFAEDLRRFAAHEPIWARRISSLARFARWVRREPARGALLLGGLAIVGAGAFVVSRWPALREELQAKLRFEESESVERALEEAYLHLGEETEISPIESFRAVLARDPRNVEALAGLLLALAWSHRVDEARRVLGEHADLLATHPELGWADVELLRLEGREAEAEARAKTLEARVDAAALFLRGLGELERGHRGEVAAFARAESLLRRAVTGSLVARRIYHYVWAHAVGHGGKEETRREVAEALRRLWPESSIARFWAVFVMDGLETPAEAAKEWRALAELLPREARVWSNLAKALKEGGDLPGALEAHRKALEVWPEFADGHYNLGITLVAAKRYDEAEQAYLRAIQLEPKDRGAHTNLGNLLLSRSRPAAAAEVLERGLQDHPDSAELRCCLGAAYRQLERLEDAEKQLVRSIELEPHAATWVQLGLVQRDGRRGPEAVASFDRAIALDPAWCEAYLHRGMVLERLNDLPAARRSIVDGLRCRPGDPNFESALGSVDLAEGDVVACLERQERSMPALHAVASPHQLRAECLLELGRLEEARNEIERACEIDLSFLRNRRVRGRIWLWLGRAAEAVSEFEGGSVSQGELERARIAALVASSWEIAADPSDLPVEPAPLEAVATLASAKGEHLLAWRAFQALEEVNAARFASLQRPQLFFVAAREAVRVAERPESLPHRDAALESAVHWLERARAETKLEIARRLAADVGLSRGPELLRSAGVPAGLRERWERLSAPR